MADLTAEQMDKIFGADEGAPASALAPESADVAQAETESAPAAVEAPPNPALERARAALERDGWSKDDLGSLKEERLLELGAKRAKHQEKVDVDYRELHSFRDKTREKADGKGPDSVPVPLVDISAGLKSIEAEFGVEAAKAFEGMLTPLVRTVERLHKSNEIVTQSEAQRERARLQSVASGVYPEAADGLVAEAVFTVARQIVAANEGMSDDDAVKQAAEMLRGKREPVKAGNLGNVAQAQPRAKAQVPLTEAQRDAMVMARIERGDYTRDDLRKIHKG